MPSPLILGSSSAIEPLHYDPRPIIQQISPNVDESPTLERHRAIWLLGWRRKSQDLARRHPDAVVIGSDQVGICEQRLPANRAPLQRPYSRSSKAAASSPFFIPRSRLLGRANGKIEVLAISA